MAGQCANPGIPVLITRPEPQASRFAEELMRACPHARAILAPLMQAEFLPVSLPPGPWGALVLTSETGAEAAGRLTRQSLPLPKTAFCVGDRTAQTAAGHGFATRSAGGDAQDLLALILSAPDMGPLLWLRGEQVARDLGPALERQGRNLQSVIAYRQVDHPLPPRALAALARPGPLVLPVFSPRSARLLAAALPMDVAADLLPVAISLRALSGLPERLRIRGIVADAPDGAAMIRAIVGTISDLVP